MSVHPLSRPLSRFARLLVVASLLAAGLASAPTLAAPGASAEAAPFSPRMQIEAAVVLADPQAGDPPADLCSKENLLAAREREKQARAAWEAAPTPEAYQAHEAARKEYRDLAETCNGAPARKPTETEKNRADRPSFEGTKPRTKGSAEEAQGREPQFGPLTTAGPAIPMIPWDPFDASIAASDDDDAEYTLPFTFPFFGRDIVAINVNTNGLIELLESGESCYECDDYGTHDEGDHVGEMDAIFAANDDLDSGVLIEGFSDRVEVIWIGTTHEDDDFTSDELTFKVILFDDGRVQWKFFDMDYSSYDYDLFSGLYDEVGDTEYEVEGGSTSFSGESVNTAFEFDPTEPEDFVPLTTAGPAIPMIPWDPNDASIAGDDDDDTEYDLPFTFPSFGRDIVAINVNTNGLIELLESGESCYECDDYGTHDEGDHVGEMDAIFAANDDLDSGVLIEGFSDRVEVIWIGTTHEDDDFTSDELTFKVTLFDDGRVQWKFFDMDYSSYEYDLFSGLYDEVGDTEYEVEGGSTSFSGEGVNKAFGWGEITISGMKFNDLDGDGVKDAGEGGLDGWTIFLDANNSGGLDGGETSTVTAGGGLYSFTVPIATYKVREVQQSLWTQTTPNPADISADASGVDFGNVLLEISSFTPGSNTCATSVIINGHGFIGVTSVKFNGFTAAFTVLSTQSIRATVPNGATTGRIKVTTPVGTVESATDFHVLPKITSFTPASGLVGSAVTVSGCGFFGTSVKINGVSAPFTVLSVNSIKITSVPTAATTGKITVTTGEGTATSATNFKVLPKINSFSPGSGRVGTVVTINGTGFTGATSVKFGARTASFSVISSTQIRAIVPASAATGKITVTTPGGSATSSSNFTVAS